MTHTACVPRSPLGSFLLKVFTILLFSILCLPASLRATHNLAGQISAERVGGITSRTYRLTLTTYTDPAPAGVDRCSADFVIYDRNTGNRLDSIIDVPRSNGPNMLNLPSGDCSLSSAQNGIPVKGTVKENIYIAEYTFPGPGTYDIIYTDLARHGGVVNICEPTNQVFSVVTTLRVPSPLNGGNNSVVLLNQPLDDACVGKLWTHQPGAWDVDGDSLSYAIVGSEVFDPEEPYNPATGNPGAPGCYQFPDDPAFGNSSLTIDPLTGLVSWETPQQPGIYNFGIRIFEWRNGEVIGFVLRDMAVFVIPCNNNPPIIETIRDTCVYAGQSVEFDYLAYDPDSVDSLYLQLNNGTQGNNGPFQVDNSATLAGEIINLRDGSSTFYTTLPQATNNRDNLPLTDEPDTIKGTVSWQTACDNIRKEHYQVDFYATDNRRYDNEPNNATLAANRSVAIFVIPPPPENLQTRRDGRGIRLEWDPPFCDQTLLRYRIFRKANGSSFAQDSVCCDQSPEEAGFQLIDSLEAGDGTTYLDELSNVEEGLGDSLCYAITAVFESRNIPNFPGSESCAADDCIDLDTEPIYLTNDSIGVDFTDPVDGKVFLSWTRPEIDLLFPAPYTYHIYRANNNGFPAIQVATQAYDDTTFLDEGLDTEARGYNYRVEIFDATDTRIEASNETNVGSTIFLETNGTGNSSIDLRWTEYVPWDNTQYEIYRSTSGGAFELIEIITGTGANVHTYQDTSLNPVLEYCYYIRSVGTWAQPERIKDPLINDSQVACDFAQDDEAPCPPTVNANLLNGNCDADLHELTIVKSDQDCDGDAVSISVVFSATPEGPFREILTIDYADFDNDTTVFFNSVDRAGILAGCYAVTATDSLGNVSGLSAVNCVDFCPELVMSNIFSPNDDNINDFLQPKSQRDVVLVNFRIYDRYGRLMAQATQVRNPDRWDLWDGIVQSSGKPALEGVYFYVLDYEELGLNGNTPMRIKGNATLLR